MALKFGDEASIKAVAKASPHEGMLISFGTMKRKACGDCVHFILLSGEGWTCGVYERTNHCDRWQSDWQACGKWERG